MGTTKLVYQISTALAIVLFIFAGSVKVIPGLSPEIHDEMVSTYFSIPSASVKWKRPIKSFWWLYCVINHVVSSSDPLLKGRFWWRECYLCFTLQV